MARRPPLRSGYCPDLIDSYAHRLYNGAATRSSNRSEPPIMPVTRFAVDRSIYGKTIPALGQRRITMAQKNDWSKIENVFAFLEKKDKGRKLRESEKILIRGQRQINRRFFEAINEILENISPSRDARQRTAAESSRAVIVVKKSISKVPGEAPPGC